MLEVCQKNAKDFRIKIPVEKVLYIKPLNEFGVYITDNVHAVRDRVLNFNILNLFMEISLKGFNELHVSLKATIIGTLLIMPVWFIDIYFFDKLFFDATPIYITTIISFILTSGWFVVNLILLQNMLRHDRTPENKKDLLSLSVFFAYVILICFSAYWYYFEWSFKIFVAWTFGFCIGLSILLRITPVVKPRKS